MITEKQKELLQFCHRNGKLTKKEAVELIGGNYYCNGSKHTGDVLGRMVKRGMLKRIKPGLFVIGSLINESNQIEDPNQLKLI